MPKKKYHLVKMPLEAYDDFINKKMSIEKSLKQLTGKEIKIPMTRVLKLIANKQIFIEDVELKKSFNKRRIGNGY